MALNLGPTITEDSINTFTNKSIDAELNQISNLKVENLKPGVLDTDLIDPPDNSTIASAKAIKTRIDERIHRNQNLNDVTDISAARTNLDVYSKTEVANLITNSDDTNDTYGVVSTTKDSQGNYLSIITTTPSGRVKTELFTYNTDGSVHTIQTLIPALSVNRVETFNYDASGDFIGISV